MEGGGSKRHIKEWKGRGKREKQGNGGKEKGREHAGEMRVKRGREKW